jgi:protein-arginine kinase activator protein McsA
MANKSFFSLGTGLCLGLGVLFALFVLDMYSETTTDERQEGKCRQGYEEDREMLSIKELSVLMDECIARDTAEGYEEAAKIRDLIKNKTLENIGETKGNSFQAG